MRTEYVVEVYNKYCDSIQEQIDVFNTYEEAKAFVENGGFELDRESEYVEITEIEYDDDEDEIGIRTGLVAQ